MVKTAADYPVTFPFGATSAPYSPSFPHRGNDRAAPKGTPVQIGTTLVGAVGSTGLSTGPHLHTQAGIDFYAQNPLNPTPYEFKPGVVVETGTASEWGNYIIIKTNSGVYVIYAHLNKINVKVGDKIGEPVVKISKAQDQRMVTDLQGDRAPGKGYQYPLTGVSLTQKMLDDKLREWHNIGVKYGVTMAEKRKLQAEVIVLKKQLEENTAEFEETKVFVKKG